MDETVDLVRSARNSASQYTGVRTVRGCTAAPEFDGGGARGAVLWLRAPPARTCPGIARTHLRPRCAHRARPTRRAALHIVVVVSTASGTMPGREGRFSAWGDAGPDMGKKCDLARSAPNAAIRRSAMRAVRGCMDAAIVDDGEAQCAILWVRESAHPGIACVDLCAPGDCLACMMRSRALHIAVAVSTAPGAAWRREWRYTARGGGRRRGRGHGRKGRPLRIRAKTGSGGAGMSVWCVCRRPLRRERRGECGVRSCVSSTYLHMDQCPTMIHGSAPLRARARCEHDAPRLVDARGRDFENSHGGERAGGSMFGAGTAGATRMRATTAEFKSFPRAQKRCGSVHRVHYDVCACFRARRT